MQPLLWCFFSWRGRLNRQEFALGFFFVVLVTYLLGQVLVSIMIGPTNDGLTWTRNGIILAQAKAKLLSYVVTLWPTLALQVKRLRHMGYSPLYLVGANILVGALLLVAPTIAVILAAVASLVLFFMPGRRV